MAENAGNLNIGVKIDFSSLKNQLKSANRATSKASARMQKTFNNLANIAKKALIGVGVAFAGITVSAIKAASDAEEIQGKFDVVFKGLTDDAEEFSSSLAKSVGRANQEIKGFLSGLQDLFVPFGFTRKEALELDKTLVKLAIDVASFNNKIDADVIRDFRAALTGSNETVQKYGVIINDVTLKQEALSQGITKNIRELTLQEKALLKVSLIQKGSTDAQGDAIRTASSFANQMKRLRGNILNVREELGNKFLPVFNEMVTDVNKFLQQNKKQVEEWSTAFSDGVKKSVGATQEFIEKIGGLEGVLEAVRKIALILAGILVTKLIVSVVSTTAAIISLGVAISVNTAKWIKNTTAIIANSAAKKTNSAISVLPGLDPSTGRPVVRGPFGPGATSGPGVDGAAGITFARRLGQIVGKLGGIIFSATGVIITLITALSAFIAWQGWQWIKNLTTIFKNRGVSSSEAARRVGGKRLQERFEEVQRKKRLGIVSDKEKQRIKETSEIAKKAAEKIKKAAQDRQAAIDSELAKQKAINEQLMVRNRLEETNLKLKNTSIQMDVKSALLGAIQSATSGISTGFTTGGAAVALTSQELFGKGKNALTKDALFIGDQIKALGKTIEQQTIVKDKLEKQVTGDIQQTEILNPI